MSHRHGDLPPVRYATGMLRRLALVSLVFAGCSKSAAQQDTGVASGGTAPVGGQVMVPGAMKGSSLAFAGDGAEKVPTKGGADDSSKLHADEGKLAIDVPANLKAGAEASAMVSVTPAAGYHVNTEYPIELTLQAPAGVTLAKTKFTAGGMDKAKGDADKMEEKGLVLAVKLTPSAAGTYTINGTFKFAVCQEDACHPKKETVAIVVAAK